MHGNDRQEAIEAMDDDDKFDRWLAEYDRKQKVEAREQARRAGMGGGGGGRRVSQQEMVARYAKVHGGEG